MIKVILNGAAGRMGKEIVARLEGNNDLSLAAKVDKLGGDSGCLTSLSEYSGDADVIIDFSHHSATNELIDYAVKKNIPLLIATTGHTEDEMNCIKKASEKIAVFHSANMSVGVALLAELAKKTAVSMPDADIEIVETHHNRKLDSPSGTALMLANALTAVREKTRLIMGRSGNGKREKEDIGISSVRRGNIVGIHEVIISTDNETLTLKHEAHSRSLFADGAIAAAKFLAGKPAGLYCMNDMVK